MAPTVNWQPELILIEKVIALAYQRGESPEALVNEAVTLYVEAQWQEISNLDSDPLVGLFAGSPDLAMQSEEILQQEITEKSGWTWKQPLL